MGSSDEHDDVISVAEALAALGMLASELGGPSDPPFEQLSGGLTNDNIVVRIPQLKLADLILLASDRCESDTPADLRIRYAFDRIVLRRFRERTSKYLLYDRDQEFTNAKLAAAAGVGPAVLAFASARPGRHGGAMLIPYVDGRTLDDMAIQRMCGTTAGALKLGKILYQLHRTVPHFNNTFDPLQSRKAYEKQVVELSGGPISWQGYENAVQELGPLQERLSGIQEKLVPCHNDLLAANFIAHSSGKSKQHQDAEERLTLIDYELSGLAPASWELGNIISENGLDGDDEAIRNVTLAYWRLVEQPDNDQQHLVSGGKDQPCWLASRIARVKAWSLISKLTWAAWGHILYTLQVQHRQTLQQGKAASAAALSEHQPFDYASWCRDRVRRARDTLADREAIEKLLIALDRDELD